MQDIRAIPTRCLTIMETDPLFKAGGYLSSPFVRSCYAEYLKDIEEYLHLYKIKNQRSQDLIVAEMSTLNQRLREDDIELDTETVDHFLKVSDVISSRSARRAEHNVEKLEEFQIAGRPAAWRLRHCQVFLTDLTHQLEQVLDEELNFYVDAACVLVGIARAYDPLNKPTAGPFDSAHELATYLDGL